MARNAGLLQSKLSSICQIEVIADDFVKTDDIEKFSFLIIV